MCVFVVVLELRHLTACPLDSALCALALLGALPFLLHNAFKLRIQVAGVHVVLVQARSLFLLLRVHLVQSSGHEWFVPFVAGLEGLLEAVELVASVEECLHEHVVHQLPLLCRSVLLEVLVRDVQCDFVQ